MATHSNILAWRIPQTEEPGRLQSIESQRIRHDFHFHLEQGWTWRGTRVLLPTVLHGQAALHRPTCVRNGS